MPAVFYARGSAILKTPVGLMRVYVGVHGGVIKSALVSGDFNVLPSAVPRLEAALKWCRAEPDAIRDATRALDLGDLGVPAEEVVAAVVAAAAGAVNLESESHPRRREGSCYFPEAEAMPQPGDRRAR